MRMSIRDLLALFGRWVNSRGAGKVCSLVSNSYFGIRTGAFSIHLCYHRFRAHACPLTKPVIRLLSYQAKCSPHPSVFFRSPDTSILSTLRITILLAIYTPAEDLLQSVYSSERVPSSYNPQPWMWGHAFMYVHHLEEFQG